MNSRTAGLTNGLIAWLLAWLTDWPTDWPVNWSVNPPFSSNNVRYLTHSPDDVDVRLTAIPSWCKSLLFNCTSHHRSYTNTKNILNHENSWQQLSDYGKTTLQFPVHLPGDIRTSCAEDSSLPWCRLKILPEWSTWMETGGICKESLDNTSTYGGCISCSEKTNWSLWYSSVFSLSVLTNFSNNIHSILLDKIPFFEK